MGAKQVEAFYRDDLLPVKEPADIFTLETRNASNLGKLENREGWGAKSTTNLWAAIDDKRRIPLERLIFALGLRHVGDSSAKLWRVTTAAGPPLPPRWMPPTAVKAKRGTIF